GSQAGPASRPGEATDQRIRTFSKVIQRTSGCWAKSPCVQVVCRSYSEVPRAGWRCASLCSNRSEGAVGEGRVPGVSYPTADEHDTLRRKAFMRQALRHGPRVPCSRKGPLRAARLTRSRTATRLLLHERAISRDDAFWGRHWPPGRCPGCVQGVQQNEHEAAREPFPGSGV